MFCCCQQQKGSEVYRRKSCRIGPLWFHYILGENLQKSDLARLLFDKILQTIKKKIMIYIHYQFFYLSVKYSVPLFLKLIPTTYQLPSRFFLHFKGGFLYN